MDQTPDYIAKGSPSHHFKISENCFDLTEFHVVAISSQTRFCIIKIEIVDFFQSSENFGCNAVEDVFTEHVSRSPAYNVLKCERLPLTFRLGCFISLCSQFPATQFFLAPPKYETFEEMSRAITLVLSKGTVFLDAPHGLWPSNLECFPFRLRRSRIYWNEGIIAIEMIDSHILAFQKRCGAFFYCTIYRRQYFSQSFCPTLFRTCLKNLFVHCLGKDENIVF